MELRRFWGLQLCVCVCARNQRGTTYGKMYGNSPAEANRGNGKREKEERQSQSVCVGGFGGQNLIRSQTTWGKDWVKEQGKWRVHSQEKITKMFILQNEHAPLSFKPVRLKLNPAFDTIYGLYLSNSHSVHVHLAATPVFSVGGGLRHSCTVFKWPNCPQGNHRKQCSN